MHRQCNRAGFLALLNIKNHFVRNTNTVKVKQHSTYVHNIVTCQCLKLRMQMNFTPSIIYLFISVAITY